MNQTNYLQHSSHHLSIKLFLLFNIPFKNYKVNYLSINSSYIQIIVDKKKDVQKPGIFSSYSNSELKNK